MNIKITNCVYIWISLFSFIEYNWYICCDYVQPVTDDWWYGFPLFSDPGNGWKWSQIHKVILLCFIGTHSLYVQGKCIYTAGSLLSFLQISAGQDHEGDKQRVLMHGHQGWNVRHGLCHIYMIYVYIWDVYSFCLFCCLFIIVMTQFVALYKSCKPKPKPSTYDPRTTTPWQRSKDRYLNRSQSNKYAINMQIQTISVSK